MQVSGRSGKERIAAKRFAFMPEPLPHTAAACPHSRTQTGSLALAGEEGHLPIPTSDSSICAREAVLSGKIQGTQARRGEFSPPKPGYLRKHRGRVE